MDSLLVYDGQKAQLDAYAIRDGHNLLTATAKVQGNLAEVLAREPGEALPLEGSVEAKLHDLPLGEIPFLADREIGGFVRGDIAVKGLFKSPEASVHLEIPGLKFGPGGYFETAEVSLDITPPRGGQTSMAKAKLTLGAHDGGRLDAQAHTRIGWELGAVPTLKEDPEAEAWLSVKRFRLSTIEPLVADQVSRLDGYLDGAVRLGLGAKPGFSGRIRLTEGVFQIPSIGQAFEEASFEAIATPAGELRIQDLRAEAGNGRVLGEAAVKMNGLVFQSARAEISIPDGRDLPVTMEGVPLGEARGKVILAAVNKGKEIAVDVQVPKLHLELPPTIGRSVQPLDENEDIVTSAPLSREEYEARTSPPDEPEKRAPGKPLVIQVRMGDIRIGGDMVQASITGEPKRPIRIAITDEARVGGDIRILSGKLEVLGKEFVIEPSLVHLREEDSSNPYLNVTAYHDADDGTRIYIDYIGKLQPITEDKIHFRSDPPRSENEVLAQLLFGSDYAEGTLAGGSTAGQPPAAGSANGSPVGGAAAGVGAGVASAQINAILQSFGPLQHFETQLSTTDGGALKTSLGYELGERVTASASYQGAGQQRQTAPGGTAQGQSQTEVSLEWRFVRNWILRAAVGTGESTTTSLDVLWKHRY
jgi:translocation and assembly module TamB